MTMMMMVEMINKWQGGKAVGVTTQCFLKCLKGRFVYLLNALGNMCKTC